MRCLGNVRSIMLLASMLITAGSMLSAASPSQSAALPETATPLAALHDLVGSWKCTYRAGTTSLAYDATYAYDRDGHLLREAASWAGGGDEELLAYDGQRRGWNVTVLDDQGNATVMRGLGSNPKHFSYRSVYPDTSIAVVFDRLSPTQYTLHGTVRSGGKTITSVDTCQRGAPTS